MLSTLKSRAAEHLANIPGWRTNERIVVIESDDWGAVRTPSKQTLDALQRINGIETSLFDSLDCLESGEDLSHLAEVLRSVKDRDGRPAKLTANTVMGNPDFDAILESGFTSFHGESLFRSYERYHGKDLWPLWRSLMDEDVWQPQFHADYHLDTERWMQDLRAGNPSTREACRLHCYGQKQVTGCRPKNQYLAAFHAESQSDIAVKADRVYLGLERFEEGFGFKSKTFIPCKYVWPTVLDHLLTEKAVKIRQGNRVGFEPQLREPGALQKQRRYWRSKRGIRVAQTVRNVSFETFEDQRGDWPNRALGQVSRAFLWRKPAVIATHRINFVGGLDPVHRNRSLKQLQTLLEGIVRHWPDVKFLSSDELVDWV